MVLFLLNQNCIGIDFLLNFFATFGSVLGPQVPVSSGVARGRGAWAPHGTSLTKNEFLKRV